MERIMAQKAPKIETLTAPDGHILLGAAGDQPISLNLKYANRHGLIAGATGTGKTVTLQIMAESFSNAGVPVFLADVKGDLSGMCQGSNMESFLVDRANTIGLNDYISETFPAVFWDLLGDQGHPIRTTISEMGPLLLSRLLELNDTQEGVLNIAFRLADEQGLLILDLKDLQSLLVWLGQNTGDITLKYGNVTKATIGTIQRRLLTLEQQGGANFFGEPALNINDFMRRDREGKGHVNILAADKLIQSPRLYATFLLWLLSELFEELPEAGDLDKPKLVFFFDEAHLLFNEAPKALLEKVEQVVRLIRSKGVGVYFVTQNPTDVPDAVLSQLGNKVQHALRAFTPRGQKAVRVAADTFRPNPDFDTEIAIKEVGVGEALVSTLEKKAVPSVVQRTLIRPPASCLGPADADKRKLCFEGSPVSGLYDTVIDRESAFEILKKRAEEKSLLAEKKAKEEELEKQEIKQERAEKASKPRKSNRQSVGEAFAKSMIRTIGTQIGREIMRGLLGSFKR